MRRIVYALLLSPCLLQGCNEYSQLDAECCGWTSFDIAFNGCTWLIEVDGGCYKHLNVDIPFEDLYKDWCDDLVYPGVSHSTYRDLIDLRWRSHAELVEESS